MKLDKTVVKYTATLARMRLSEAELELLSSQLNDVLKYVEKLNKVDTSNVEAMNHVLPLKNVYREDKISKSLTVEDALANAPDKDGNLFKVPKIIS